MAEEAILKKLDEALSKARSLNREHSDTVAKLEALEREAGELRSLISLAESKADDMLNGGSDPDASRGPVTRKEQVTSVPPKSKGLQELMEPSASQKEELKRRFPHAFDPA